MADGTRLNSNSTAGDLIASDELSSGGFSGQKAQVVKVMVGADGAGDLVSNSNPVPVSDAGDSITVDGTVDLGAATLAALGTVNVTDGGGSITVDGTVELGPTALAALETITVASVTAPLAAGNNNIGNVGIVTMPNVTLAAGTNTNEVVGDAAHDATVAGNPLLVGGFASAAAPTDVSADGDAVRAWMLRNGAQATVVTAAGALIGGDATNGLDVDVTRIVPGTGSTNLGKAEDAAHTSADVGVMALAVRRDADTTLVDATGDYAPLQVNASGSLKVAITSGAGSGGTSIADGASFTRDTTSITPAGAAVESSAPTLTNGDVAALSMTTGGALRVAVASGGVAGVVEDAASAGGEEGVMMLAVRRDVASSGVSADGDFAALSVDSNGALRVTGGGSVAQDAAAAGNPVLAGLRASTATPTAMSADGDAVYGWADRNGATVIAGRLVDDSQFTPGTDRVVPIAFQADETATDSVDEGDAGCPRMTLDRKVIVTDYAHAAGGATPGRILSAASTNGTVVKASAGSLYSLIVTNTNAAVRYLKIYNSTSVTVGTTTPVWTIAIPGSTTGAGCIVPIPACGISFGTGICMALTTGAADTDTGAVAANEICVNYAYI